MQLCCYTLSYFNKTLTCKQNILNIFLNSFKIHFNITEMITFFFEQSLLYFVRKKKDFKTLKPLALKKKLIKLISFQLINCSL